MTVSLLIIALAGCVGLNAIGAAFHGQDSDTAGFLQVVAAIWAVVFGLLAVVAGCVNG